MSVFLSFDVYLCVCVMNVWHARPPNACTNVIRKQSWTLNTEHSSTQLKSLMDGILYIAEQSTVHTCSQQFSLSFCLIQSPVSIHIYKQTYTHMPFRNGAMPCKGAHFIIIHIGTKYTHTAHSYSHWLDSGSHKLNSTQHKEGMKTHSIRKRERKKRQQQAKQQHKPS